MDRLAKLPLAYQPGSTWDYSYSTDVLGRVIEVVTGKPLLQAMKERLLDPLGLASTSFYVTDAAKHARVVEPFGDDRNIGTNANLGNPRVALKWESGGGGLMSTAMEYARFAQMLLNGGTLDAAYPAEAGTYYWGGAGGTYFWVDPKTDLFVVFMMQSPKQRVYYRTLLHDMVTAAVMK